MKQLIFLKFKKCLHFSATKGANKNAKDLCDTFELKNFIKDSTCFGSLNLSCIDNFYTNKKTSFFLFIYCRS